MIDFKNFKEKNLRIGLLGGSFDPPHQGHLHISKDALRRFNLDYIWWLVIQQNPFKENQASSINQRLRACSKIIDSDNIITFDIENNINSIKTIDHINFISNKCFNNKYYWIMGSDLLVDFDKWDNYQQILKIIKIIVYERPNYWYKDIQKKINPWLLKYKTDIKTFLLSPSPSWVLVKSASVDISSTQLRSTNENT